MTVEPACTMQPAEEGSHFGFQLKAPPPAAFVGSESLDAFQHRQTKSSGMVAKLTARSQGSPPAANHKTSNIMPRETAVRLLTSSPLSSSHEIETKMGTDIDSKPREFLDLQASDGVGILSRAGSDEECPHRSSDDTEWDDPHRSSDDTEWDDEADNGPSNDIGPYDTDDNHWLYEDNPADNPQHHEDSEDHRLAKDRGNEDDCGIFFAAST